MNDFIDYAKHHNRTALIDSSGKSTTYQELDSLTREVAATLTNGLALLECQNEVEAIVFYLAALRAHCPIILVNPQDTKNIQNLFERYPVKYHYHTRENGWTLNTLDVNGELNIHPELSVILSTSGSTGSAKQIKLSLNNITSNADSIAEYLKIDSDHKTITTLPFNYSYGLSVINSHLLSGASIVLSNLSVTDPLFWNIFKTEECCSFAGVPHTYELLLTSGMLSQDLPTLRYFTQAGGKLAEDRILQLDKIAADKNADFVVMYGQTEATARMAYLPPDQLRNKIGFIGIAIPGGKLSLTDENGREIFQPYVDGELVYKGPNVMMGYASSLEDLAVHDNIGILKTGDIAQFDEDNYYKITGRLNRFIKPFGIRVGLDELERSLSLDGFDCVCTGTDEQLMIAISSENEVHHVREKVTKLTHLPSSIINVQVISPVPRLSNGKIDYPQLRNDFKVTQQEDNIESKPVDVRIASIYCRRLMITDAPKDATFRELGGDSLTYVQVSMDLEQVLGTLPSEWENRSISDLANQADETPRSKHLSTIDSSSVVRAWSVSAVVMNHAGLVFWAGGAQLLLLVSGLNLARFQWSNLLDGQFQAFSRSLLLNILLPYWAILIAYPLLKSEPVNLYGLLLIINLIPGENVTGFPAWFISALFHCLVITALPLAINPIRRWIKANELYYATILLSFGIAVRLADGWFEWGTTLGTGGEQTSWVYWLFALGVANFFTRTPIQKAVFSVLTIVLPAIFYAGDLPRIITISTGGLLLIWYSSISVPRALKGIIAVTGSASLFIYLLHSRAPTMLVPSLPIDIPRILIGILIGIAGWKLYSIGIKLATDLKAKLMNR